MQALRTGETMPSALGKVTSKMLGDAGEHFALSQLMFAGMPASKMPDGWAGHDPAVETGQGLVRVSVKTRKETASWKAGSWFIFDERLECDWLVFIFLPINDAPRFSLLAHPFFTSTRAWQQAACYSKRPAQSGYVVRKVKQRALMSLREQLESYL
jgi:hypothetical protein